MRNYGTSMSVFLPIADIQMIACDGRFVPIGDIRLWAQKRKRPPTEAALLSTRALAVEVPATRATRSYASRFLLDGLCAEAILAQHQVDAIWLLRQDGFQGIGFV